MNRRTLLSGAACATTLSFAGLSSRFALAGGATSLSVDNRTIEVNGKAAKVYGLVGPGGQSGLSFNAGDTFDVLLHNRLAEETMIHWHGLTPPNKFDGVPNMPMPLLKAGEQRSYSFPVGSGGTNWMHAHTLQEQALLAAPLIVRTAEDRVADEQEVVILLHDFSFKPATEILADLKKGSGGQMSHGNMDMTGTDTSGMDMSGMNMGGMDLNDIAYDAYLANDRTLDDPEIIKAENSGRIRLRIINGATATGFTIDTGELDASLIAVDGQPIVPVTGRRFPLAMGQRADLRIQLPKAGGVFPILALREGAPERTGIIVVTPGASVERIAPVGTVAGPVLDLMLEQQLTAVSPLSVRPADRKFMAHLSGNMVDYTWAIGGEPIKVREGERIEISMMNMSMMSHPMHLHGHHFQITAIDGKPFAGAVRDTVLVPSMRTVTFAFDANNPGAEWAFHCHQLYHMASGMMTTVSYEGA